MSEKKEMDRFSARTKKGYTNINSSTESYLLDIEEDLNDVDFEKKVPFINSVGNELPMLKGLNLDSENDILYKRKKLPIIGNKEVSSQYKIVGAVATLSLVSLLSGGFFYSVTNDKINKVVENSNVFSMDIQRANLLFSESLLGKPESINELNEVINKARSSFNSLNELTGGDVSLNKEYENLNRNIAILKNNFELLNSSNERVAEFNKEIMEMDAKIDRFISIYSRKALNQNELANVYALKISLQILNANYSNVLLSDKINDSNINLLNQYREAFKDILLTLKDGDRVRSINPIQTRELIEAYNVIVPSWTQISNKIQTITGKSKELIETKNLNESTYKYIVSIVNKTTQMINKYKSNQSNLVLLSQIAILLGLIFLLLSIVSIFYIYSYEKDNKESEENAKKEKLEMHMNDMVATLLYTQGGDLRNDLKVHEGATSYLADSINTTIEALRTLVKQSIDMAGLLEEKTSEIKTVSEKMLLDTEKQAKDIKETGASVILISEAINKISNNTIKGYEEAQKTVQISRDGNTQVGESLGVMKEIKNNMEETVSLMRKVFESSKQILSIVEILSEINQDTEILSMNVTVQATRAGEAGKPYKIVADSFKALSERSALEGKKASGLLNGIVNDIKVALSAIEKTRNEVEHGVNVTEKAFESFAVMKDTTEKLAVTVESISKDAKEHAKTAVQVEKEMREILTTTETNRKSTEDTVNAIKDISTVAQDMTRSVKTFKI